MSEEADKPAPTKPKKRKGGVPKGRKAGVKPDGERKQGRSLLGEARWPALVDLVLLGRKPVDIAKELNVATQIVAATTKHPAVVEMIETARAARREQWWNALQAPVMEAISTLIGIMRGEPDEDGRPTVDARIRLDAVKTLLDRVGITAANRVELTGANGAPVQSTPVIDVSGLTLETARAMAGWAPEPAPLDDAPSEG